MLCWIVTPFWVLFLVCACLFVDLYLFCYQLGFVFFRFCLCCFLSFLVSLLALSFFFFFLNISFIISFVFLCPFLRLVSLFVFFWVLFVLLCVVFPDNVGVGFLTPQNPLTGCACETQMLLLFAVFFFFSETYFV